MQFSCCLLEIWLTNKLSNSLPAGHCFGIREHVARYASQSEIKGLTKSAHKLEQDLNIQLDDCVAREGSSTGSHLTQLGEKDKKVQMHVCVMALKNKSSNFFFFFFLAMLQDHCRIIAGCNECSCGVMLALQHGLLAHTICCGTVIPLHSCFVVVAMELGNPTPRSHTRWYMACQAGSSSCGNGTCP